MMSNTNASNSAGTNTNHINANLVRTGYDNDILERLKRARRGCHYIVVYLDLPSLRKIYSQYIKRQIEVKKEIVLILTYYESSDMVRYVLSNMAALDVTECEKQGSLLIIDSSRAYFGHSIDMVSFVKSLINYAYQIDRDGVTIIADMGSFFSYNKLNDLIKYEKYLQQRTNIKVRDLCFYKMDDFERRVSSIRRRKILHNHDKRLMIAPTVP